MGGVGSSPAGGGGGYSSGELLSSLGGGLSSLLGKAADGASSVRSAVSSARDVLQERASFDLARDMGHLQRGGNNCAPEGSRDLSDLLGGCDLDQMPPPPAAAAPNGRSVATDDGWGDDSWGEPPSAAAKAPPTPGCAPAAATISAMPTSVHYSGASGATPSRRKVAAAKVKNDSSWDDWGDDKW